MLIALPKVMPKSLLVLDFFTDESDLDLVTERIAATQNWYWCMKTVLSGCLAVDPE